MTSTGSTAPAGAGEDLLRRHRGETVLITGASSGIGRELARQFAGDGADLVLIARSEDRLRELAGELTVEYGVTVEVVPADLSRPGSPDQIVETLARRHIDVDVLVNNAGFGARGPVAGIGVARQLEMVEVNVAALTRLTALLLPGMLERRRGGILNVASTAAFQPGPNSAVYYATKAYVLSFTEALAEEVRGSGVRVSCLAPGPTDTGFAAQAGAAGSRLFRRGVMDAGRVARAGHDGLRRGKTLVIPGLRNRALAFGVRLSPRILVTKISGYMQAWMPARGFAGHVGSPAASGCREAYFRPRRVIVAFPTNDSQVCTYLAWPRAELRSVRADAEAEVWAAVALAPGLAGRLRAGQRATRVVGTGDLPNFFRTPYGPGWALVGDAGYHRDPLTAQGISDAFRDAQLLSEAIDAGLAGQQPLPEALAGYQRRRDEGSTAMYELTCQGAALEPPAPQMTQLVAALRGNQGDTDRFLGVVAGTVAIPEFFAPGNIERILAASTVA